MSTRAARPNNSAPRLADTPSAGDRTGASDTNDGGFANPLLIGVSGLEAKHLVYLPDPVAGGVEASAGQGNQRRHDDAKARLGRAIPGLVTQVDNSDCLAEPVVLHRIPPFDVEALWGVLDTVLTQDDARSGRMVLGLRPDADESDGELQFATTYEVHRPSLGALASKLTDQASVTVRTVERHLEVLAHIAADLTTILGQACHMDLIAFGPGAMHVDESDRGGDLLLVPLDAPLGIAPSADNDTAKHDARPSPPTQLLPVNPSEAVLVRMGQAAHVTSADLALVLRVVLPVLDASTLRLAAAAAGRYHPLLRADLPADLDGPILSYGGSLYDNPGAFHAEAGAALAPESQYRTAAWLRASVPASPRYGLLKARRALTDPLPALRAPLPGGIMLSKVGDQVALAAGGLVVTLDPLFASLLVPHLDGRPFDAAAMVHQLREHVRGTTTSPNDSLPTSANESVETGESGEPVVDPVLQAFRSLLAIELLEAVQ